MRHFKKALVVILAVVMAVMSTGCSDLTWSFKTDDTTVSIGTYIFYEYRAMSEASDLASDSGASILDQTIENTPAEEWIRDKALDSIKKYLVVEKLMNDMKLTVSSEDESSASAYTQYIWNSYGAKDSFEPYGISYDSYYKATQLYNIKNEMVFKAIYDKDGTKAVSDEDLKKYFVENYSDYYFITHDLTTTDDDGEPVAMTDEEIAEVKKEFESYVTMMNKDKKSYEEVVKAYIEYAGLDTDDEDEDADEEEKDITENSPSTHHTAIIDNSALDESVRDDFKEVEEGKAAAFIDGEGVNAKYYFVYKTSIEDRSEEFLKDSSDRLSVLESFKGDEYDEYIKEQTKSIEYTTNEKALKKYSPKIFEEEFMQ